MEHNQDQGGRFAIEFERPQDIPNPLPEYFDGDDGEKLEPVSEPALNEQTRRWEILVNVRRAKKAKETETTDV